MGVRQHSASSPKLGHVKFASTLVTSVARPLTSREHAILAEFEDHAASCGDCYDPYRAYKQQRPLCGEGRELAVEISSLLFKLNADGHVYTTSTDDGELIRIEIPQKYQRVIGLFAAIQNSKRDILRRPLSYDRNFPVQPRYPVHASQLYGPTPEQIYYHQQRMYSPRSSDYSSTSSVHRRPRSSYRMSHGSLFDLDQQAQIAHDLREKYARYDYGHPYYGYYT